MSRGRTLSILLLCAAAGVLATLVMLGNWQLHRLAWKTELIETIGERAFGDPVPAPRGEFDPAAEAYRRVTIAGRFLHDRTRFVKALTELGAGYWVMTPLDDGARKVWVNRGFVPDDRRAGKDYERSDNRVDIVGLIRVTEPDGTLLQDNDPGAGRWYSRDIAALSRETGVDAEPDWFIDADSGSAETAPPWPRAGLTRLEFRNSHLGYALTWYTMALGLAFGIGYAVYLERRPSP